VTSFSRLTNLTITSQSGDTSDRQFLDSLKLTSYQHIILLCYGDTMYRLLAEAGDSEKAYGVRVNPAKSAKVTFAAGDKVIVLAEN
jgi:hypothetical protein